MAVREAVNVLATKLIYVAKGASVTVPMIHTPAKREVRCDDALRVLCCEDGVAVADLDAAMAAMADAGLAAQAVELARVPPNERNVLATAAGTPSVQRVMNGYLAAVVCAVLPDASWAPGAELATAFRSDSEVHSLFARAGGALLQHPERHANVATAQLSAAYTRTFDDGGLLAEGLDAGLRQAAIRLAHRLLVKYYELRPHPAALPDGRLAAYSLVADGYQLYVVCVEVAYDERRMPRLVCSQHGPMPLWGKALVDYAARRREGVPALGRCYDAHAPGLVALVKLLRAGRTVLGDVAFTVPTDLEFSIRLPPPREWIHLGSGGASETYSTVAAGGRAVVVKVARQPGASWQPLIVEKATYIAMGTHGLPCAAIPTLVGVAMTHDGKSVAALVFSASGDDGADDISVETVPVEEVLAAGDVVVTALAVAWSAVVALHHAHGARVVHRDVRAANTVWKVGAVLPTGSEVAAAIAAAEAAAGASDSGGVVDAALRLLPPPPAQLVDWGVATVHPIPTATATAAAATAAEVFSRGEAVDICWLHVRLLPSLLDTDGCSVAELAARLRGPPAVVERHLGALEAASSAVEAALPVLRLLHLALTYGAAAATAATIAASWP